MLVDLDYFGFFPNVNDVKCATVLVNRKNRKSFKSKNQYYKLFAGNTEVFLAPNSLFREKKRVAVVDSAIAR